MKQLLLSLMLPLLCQCGSAKVTPDRRPSLTDSGLSPEERGRMEKNRPLSSDPADPLHKVHAADGAAGFSVMEF